MQAAKSNATAKLEEASKQVLHRIPVATLQVMIMIKHAVGSILILSVLIH